MFTSGDREGIAIGEWQGKPLYHASLAPAEYRALLAASGFQVTSFTSGAPSHRGPTVWRAQKVA